MLTPSFQSALSPIFQLIILIFRLAVICVEEIQLKLIKIMKYQIYVVSAPLCKHQIQITLEC